MLSFVILWSITVNDSNKASFFFAVSLHRTIKMHESIRPSAHILEPRVKSEASYEIKVSLLHIKPCDFGARSHPDFLPLQMSRFGLGD